jgi:hypothetical protein
LPDAVARNNSNTFFLRHAKKVTQTTTSRGSPYQTQAL